MNIWEELGIGATADARLIKRAYARRLRQVHPEDDPAGFQKLRQAYELALRQFAPGGALGERGPLLELVPPPSVVAPPPAHVSAPVPAPPPPAFTPDRLPPVDQAALSLLATLEATPDDRRRATLQDALRKAEWQQLDFQTQLEHGVLRQVLSDFARHEALIPLFAAHYGWRGAERRVGRVDPLLVQVMGRFEARRWRTAIERAEGVHARAVRAALRLLAAAPDEAAFRKFGRLTRNLKAMNELLTTLQVEQPAALSYVVDRKSYRWWLDRRDRQPMAWDRIAVLLGLGFFAGPLAALVIDEMLEAWLGFTLLGNRWIGVFLMLLSIPAPLALDVAIRSTRRRVADGVGAPWKARLGRWRHLNPGRGILVGLTAVCVGATALTAVDPHFGWAAAPALSLMWFWYGLRYCVVTTLILAWPLQAPVSLLVEQMWRSLAVVHRHSADAPVLLFPHLVASYSFAPFTRVTQAAYGRIFPRRRLREPAKLAFYCSLGLAVLCGMLLVQLDPGAIAADTVMHPAH